MQEVIVKTILIVAALAAIVLFYNRLGRKRGCGCGCSDPDACQAPPDERAKCCPPDKEAEEAEK